MKDEQITRTLNFIRKETGDSGHSIKVGSSIEDMSLFDIISKALRHKSIIITWTLIASIGALLFYKHNGVFYVREVVAQINNKTNNSLLLTLDSVTPKVTKMGAKNDPVVGRILSALATDEFITFVLEQAKNNSEIQKMIGLQNIESTAANIKDPNFTKTRNFFNSKVSFKSMDVPGAIILKIMSNGAFRITINDKNPEWINEATPLITKLVNEYIAKREISEADISRAILTDKLETYTKEIQNLTARHIKIQQDLPPVNEGIIQTYIGAMQGARLALAGNKSLEARYLSVIKEIEDKLSSVNNELGSDGEIALLRRELAGLSYQQKVEKVQGIHPESDRNKTLNTSIQKALDDLNLVLSGRDARNIYFDPSDSDVISQEQKLSAELDSVDAIKQTNEFYKSKIATLGQMLQEVKKQLDSRIALEVEQAELKRLINAKREIISNIETSLVGLEFSNFNSIKRIEIQQGSILEKGKFPFRTLMFLSTFFGFFLGVILAFFKEQKNPSLRTIQSFEEIGVPILGGVPPTEQFLFTQSSQVSQEDTNSLQYVRIGLNLGNTLNFLQSKIALFTSSEKTIQSSTICYNLGTYYARVGRKVLIIEADMHNNYICKLTGTSTSGGLHNILNSSSEVNITLATPEKNLDILSGDNTKLPALYRLSSESFYSLLNELKQNYDYILIHTRPLLESPEAADLSRYSGVSIICTDASQANIKHLERIVVELRLFLSKYTYFILEKTEDNTARYNKSKKHSNLKSDNDNRAKSPSTKSADPEHSSYKKAS